MGLQEQEITDIAPQSWAMDTTRAALLYTRGKLCITYLNFSLTYKFH